MCDKKVDNPEKTVSPKREKKEKPDPNAVSDRLNQLLAGMSTVETVSLKKTVDIPKAKKKDKKKKTVESSDSSDDDAQKPRNIVEAARKVAKTMDGDQKLTEMELLSKLLGFPMKQDSERKANLR